MEDETRKIHAILEGDHEAYRYFVERYHAGLIIHCEQLVKDRHDAEDIAQEAFCQAYSKLGEFDPERARFSTWLYRIATNKAIDHLRRGRHHTAVEDVEYLAEFTMPADIPADEIEALRIAVKSLTPPEYRKVIEAYFWEGKSYDEIARTCGVPRNTVGTWMSRAKLKLRKELAS